MPLDVLIVDDSAAIRKVVQRMLNQAQVPLGKVLEAGDGVEALAALRQHPVHLVLTDINMPNMDGLQLLGQIRGCADWAKIPVIMITTEGGEAKVMEAVQRGANGYVRKPFTADQIKEKLDGLF
jgi:two-component system chemotaxis response regulator CheY